MRNKKVKKTLAPNRPASLIRKPITDNEYSVIYKSVDAADQAFLDFMYHGLIRPGELLQLKHEDIKEDCILLNGKTGQRTIELNEELKAAYEKARTNQGESEFVFNRDGKAIPQMWHIGKWHRHFKMLVASKKISRKLNLYDVRFKAVVETNCVGNGVKGVR